MHSGQLLVSLKLRATLTPIGASERSDLMLISIKKVLRSLIRRMGYDFRKLQIGEQIGPDQIGQNAYSDIKRFIAPNSSPVIFDVGANVGQTIDAFREVFPQPKIHAFRARQSRIRQSVANAFQITACPFE
jgi:hypothetical protein